jgi:hypothetical protein
MIKPTAHIKDWDLGRCSLAILGQHIPEFSEGHFLFAIKKVALDNVLMRKVWFMLCERQVLEFQIVPAIDLCDFFLQRCAFQKFAEMFMVVTSGFNAKW